MNDIQQRLEALRQSGNFRSLRPDLSHSGMLDLSSNDYLGLAACGDELFDVFQRDRECNPAMTSSASRLLSLHQGCYGSLEKRLGKLYGGRSALLFNSGYHANSGIIPALCSKDTLVVADRLVHASIIDGIVLSRARFVRFRHNDLDHLQQIIAQNRDRHILVITESVFSMDGDLCDLRRLVQIKRDNPGVMLYVDEAHGFGVFGERGLGLCEQLGLMADIDVIVGTLGKAGASIGAFAITDADMRDYLINTARSFIFSTMLPPINCEWSRFMLDLIPTMTAQRRHLLNISARLSGYLASQGYPSASHSQIVPLIVGDSRRAIELSEQLMGLGYIALPIRTPTVPAGTERIRFSLSAALTADDIERLINDIDPLI